jgi:hypothetical protein
MVQTCTPSRTGSAGSYAWTGGASAVSCLANPGFGSTWDNASTCTEVAGTMACQAGSVAAVFVYDTTFPLPTCTQTRSGTAGSYVWTGGATATLCQTAAFNPTWTPTSTCTESAAVQCQVAAGTQVANQQTCTFSRTGSAGSYAWTGGASAVSCLNTGTVGAAWAPSTGNCTWTTGAAQIQCRIEPSTPWVYDTVSPQPSCTATGGGTSNGNVWTNSGGNVTLCQTSAGFNTTWTSTRRHLPGQHQPAMPGRPGGHQGHGADLHRGVYPQRHLAQLPLDRWRKRSRLRGDGRRQPRHCLGVRHHLSGSCRHAVPGRPGNRAIPGVMWRPIPQPVPPDRAPPAACGAAVPAQSTAGRMPSIPPGPTTASAPKAPLSSARSTAALSGRRTRTVPARREPVPPGRMPIPGAPAPTTAKPR